MEAISGILAIVLLLVALAPVLIAGGQLIVAFMLRKRIGVHLVWCLATLAALVGGALIALQLSRMDQKLAGVVVLAALPWIAHWLCKRFVLRDDQPEGPAP
ncbi:MAG: hypothetical protein RL341_460 [Pseudomonadota bacterium]|jgi:hypothetical protein